MASICSLTKTISGSFYDHTTSGSSVNYTAIGNIYVDYSITQNLADKVVITTKVVASVSMKRADTGANYGRAKFSISSAGNTWNVNGIGYTMTQPSTVDTSFTASADFSATQTTTVAKIHSAQNIAVNAGYNPTLRVVSPESRTVTDSIIVSGTIPISAKTSYTVSYNANGGSGAPASQTKWYGETLKLQTGTPTRTGWTFKGWATSSTATSAAYAAGANYTANSGATLYAVWQRNTYTVSYNANGGSGAPANQTKQYGIDLVLSNTAPTFSGWTFKGWATSTANASAGTVNYAKGATYTGNTALTLYAVWELTYKKPTLSNISVERCIQSGDLDDDGDCALVTADWTVFRSSLPRYYGGNTYPYANNAIAQDGYVVTAGTYTETRTPTGESDDGYSVVVGSGFDSDTSYAVTISITDTQEIVSDHTVTATGTLPAQFFPMDYNADATAVGFFMPAPKSGEGDGAYFGKDIHVYIDTATASGTDAEITQALSDLDWTDDVLE